MQPLAVVVVIEKHSDIPEVLKTAILPAVHTRPFHPWSGQTFELLRVCIRGVKTKSTSSGRKASIWFPFRPAGRTCILNTGEMEEPFPGASGRYVFQMTEFTRS
jgi:hypothetical protein